ncbi:MAG TPA: hypothetical protein VIF62_33005, partial [Labilithrix sp.]
VLCVAACGDNQTPPPAHGEYQAGAVAPLPCLPNLDGVIDANELAPVLGVNATYLVSPAGKERMVDVAGVVDADGKLTFPAFAVDYADDQAVALAASALDGKWYAGSFTGLTDPFVTPIDVADRTEGVYTHDDHGFYLHGVASTTENPPEGKTLLVYTAPVALYQFPLKPGDAWTSVGEVKNGTFRGLPYAGRDTYDVKIDGAGTLPLPDFILTQALRARTLVTVAPAAGTTTTQRQVSFLFECLGEAARATSDLNEPNENFTQASELRRLGLAPR